MKPNTDPALLERDIEAIRGQMTDVVHELDRRRRAVVDFAKQPGVIAALVGGALLLIGGAIGIAVVRSRRLRARPVRRRGPELKAPESVGHKVAAAAAAALATALIKAGTQRLIARLRGGEQPRQLTPG